MQAATNEHVDADVALLDGPLTTLVVDAISSGRWVLITPGVILTGSPDNLRDVIDGYAAAAKDQQVH